MTSAAASRKVIGLPSTISSTGLRSCNCTLAGRAVGETSHQGRRLHQCTITDCYSSLVEAAAKTCLQFTGSEQLMINLECLQVCPEKVIFTQCHLVDCGMDETIPAPLAGYAIVSDLCVEQIKASTIDAIDAAVGFQLLQIKTTIELAGSNSKTGISSGCTLPHTTRIQQQNFLVRMQCGQAPRTGQPG